MYEVLVLMSSDDGDTGQNIYGPRFRIKAPSILLFVFELLWLSQSIQIIVLSCTGMT